MNEAASDAECVVVEREFSHPPEKVWRVLTEPHLIEEWLIGNSFKPVVDHRFDLRFEWGAIGCQVLEVERPRTLSYTWGDHDLKTVVTWTLTRTTAGTRLRMEQSGFRPDQPRYFHGARGGWPRFFEKMEMTLARIA